MKPEELPYVQFSFGGNVVSLSRAQYGQALRDARLCKCGQCLCCAARAYHLEVTGKEWRTTMLSASQ
jgi:hypothetical protein